MPGGSASGSMSKELNTRVLKSPWTGVADSYREARRAGAPTRSLASVAISEFELPGSHLPPGFHFQAILASPVRCRHGIKLG